MAPEAQKLEVKRLPASSPRSPASISSIKSLLFPKLNQRAIFKLEGLQYEDREIPKIIHQTFYTRDLAPELGKNVDLIKTINPNWEYRFYTDDDMLAFINQNYDQRTLKIFRKIHPSYGAARADLFRYLLLYKCGGVYLDIKASITKPLDAILNAEDRFLICQWPQDGQFFGWGMHSELAQISRGEFQQWHIAASSRHPFLKAVIENVLSNIEMYNPSLHGTGKTGVLKVTGPVAYTLAIEPLLKLHAHRLEKSHTDLGLLYSVYSKKANGPVNEIHKEKFRSHYSTLKQPLIRLTTRKRAWSKITQFANYIHRPIVQKNRLERPDPI